MKTIAESEGFKNTKSKVDETVHATMVRVAQLFETKKQSEEEAAQPKDESRYDAAEIRVIMAI